MSDEDILAIARECCHIRGYYDETGCTPSELITFARRIQAAQKEKDAGICEQIAKNGEAGLCAAAIREQT